MSVLIKNMHQEKRLLKQLLISSFVYFTYSSIAYSDKNDLMELSVEDLLNVEVISVSKKAQSLNDSPAAIYVISQDDIKRIGATSIPEALRLAPGLDVARIDANKWAVTEGDAIDTIGSSPQQRVSLRSSISPWEKIEPDVPFRYVDTNIAISSFGTTVIKDCISMDIRLAWEPVNNLELSVVRQNLLAEQHLEYRQELLTTLSEINRGMYDELIWQL